MKSPCNLYSNWGNARAEKIHNISVDKTFTENHIYNFLEFLSTDFIVGPCKRPLYALVWVVRTIHQCHSLLNIFHVCIGKIYTELASTRMFLKSVFISYYDMRQSLWLRKLRVFMRVRSVVRSAKFQTNYVVLYQAISSKLILIKFNIHRIAGRDVGNGEGGLPPNQFVEL